MIILRDDNYNPKIDYLVCKSFLNNLPSEYDELQLRACYKGQCQPKLEYEKDLVSIKNFFENNDLRYIDNARWNQLLKIIIKKEVELSKIVNKFNLNDYKTMKEIINQLSRIYNEKNVCDIMKLLVFQSYIIKNNEIIIPKEKYIYSLMNNFKKNLFFNIRIILKKMLLKTQKYNIVHSKESNGDIFKRVIENKMAFMNKFNVIKFGIYGSFAMNLANEYSDLDMLVVLDYIDLNIKRQMLEFWCPILGIPIDLKIVTPSTYITKTTIGMRKTIKFI